jgi:hypothetical protein
MKSDFQIQQPPDLRPLASRSSPEDRRYDGVHTQRDVLGCGGIEERHSIKQE